MGRTSLVLAPLLAAAGLAGCGGGEPPGGVAGVQTVLEAAEEADGFAMREELRWLGRFAAWSERFAAAGRLVYEFEQSPRFDRALAGDSDALGRYGEVLQPIRDCAETVETEVGPAPTERLEHSERNFAAACEHFQRGVELLLEALDDDDVGVAERARYQIQDAGRKAAVAAGGLPPGEKQRLPVVRGESAKSRIDPGYGLAAAAVAGKEVEARCWSGPDWRRLMVEERVVSRGRVTEQVLGFASPGGMRINLAPRVCRLLGRLVYGRARPEDPVRRHELAMALVVLVHESRHAAGVVDEPAAECEAVQLAEEAAAELGVERRFARALVAVYWDAYPGLPPEYRSPECREGGELDLTPEDGRFP